MPGSTPSRSSRNCYVSLIPMSERQQLKLVRQLETCDNRGGNSGTNRESGPHRSRSRSCNGRGETPLHKAAIKGDEELVRKLLEEGADPNIPDFAGWTPLHEACNHGWYGVALALVQAGASVNARGFDDDTPLHDAAINGHSKLVRLLVERGADVYSRNKGGKTPCDVAAPGLMPHLLRSHSSENIELARKKSDVSSCSAQADNTAISEMRRTPPQTKVDKSPRVTLRLHQIKKRSGKLTSDGNSYNSSRYHFSVNMEDKSSKEDVYEFKSSKEATPVRGNSTSPDLDKNRLDKSGETYSGMDCDAPSLKRSITDVTENEENEEDVKKKKRKDVDGKESANSSKALTSAGRLSAVRNVNSSSEKSKLGGHSLGKGGINSKTVLTGSSLNVSNDRNSPSSPKGFGSSNANASNSAKPDGDSEDKFVDGEKIDQGPKVPPLKIVIPQQTTSEPEQGNRNGKSSVSRHPLPYIVSSNSNDGEKDGRRSRSVSPTDSSKSDDKKDPAIGMLSAEDQKGSLHHQRVLRSAHRSGTGSIDDARAPDSASISRNYNLSVSSNGGGSINNNNNNNHNNGNNNNNNNNGGNSSRSNDDQNNSGDNNNSNNNTGNNDNNNNNNDNNNNNNNNNGNNNITNDEDDNDNNNNDDEDDNNNDNNNNSSDNNPTSNNNSGNSGGGNDGGEISGGSGSGNIISSTNDNESDVNSNTNVSANTNTTNVNSDNSVNNDGGSGNDGNGDNNSNSQPNNSGNNAADDNNNDHANNDNADNGDDNNNDNDSGNNAGDNNNNTANEDNDNNEHSGNNDGNVVNENGNGNSGQTSGGNSGAAAAVSADSNPASAAAAAAAAASSADSVPSQNQNQSSPTSQTDGNHSNNSNCTPASNESSSNVSSSGNYNSYRSNIVSSKNNGSSNSNHDDKTSENNSESASIPPQQQTANPVPVELHPRKRKLKHNKEVKEPPPPPQVSSETCESANTSSEIHPHEQPVKNCYQLFLDIRKQIERRRKGLFPVQPKPPQGFKDYLMNRCTYVLAGNASTRPIPSSPVPPNLVPAIKELFNEQEKERHRLRLQHVIEKEKLVLSVEQEILRVHGRAARALANQSLPFSVCTILKDEEVYNLITPEQEEKDRNARSRYNGRLFLSWLQDVDDKWEKIKEAMLLRHHNEAESLHAVQKMDWEWKMKELGLCEFKSKPVILDNHVPMVHVSDDFDLLPA